MLRWVAWHALSKTRAPLETPHLLARLTSQFRPSDANGPVLFWIGSVFQYSNLEPVQSFNWFNLDWFWSFSANRFSKTGSKGSIKP